MAIRFLMKYFVVFWIYCVSDGGGGCGAGGCDADGGCGGCNPLSEKKANKY